MGVQGCYSGEHEYDILGEMPLPNLCKRLKL